MALSGTRVLHPVSQFMNTKPGEIGRIFYHSLCSQSFSHLTFSALPCNPLARTFIFSPGSRSIILSSHSGISPPSTSSKHPFAGAFASISIVSHPSLVFESGTRDALTVLFLGQWRYRKGSGQSTSRAAIEPSEFTRLADRITRLSSVIVQGFSIIPSSVFWFGSKMTWRSDDFSYSDMY